LEVSGLALALWAAFGLVVLAGRRLGSGRVRAVTTPMDLVVLLVLAVQVASGIWIALGYRWGSFWGTAVFTPYLWSLLTLRPRPELVVSLPFILQAHVVCFFVFLTLFPFTRLVHILTLPLGYLTRPWQRVIRNRMEPGVYREAAPEVMERV
jgi:nitrate reductase gamma subunit